MQAAKAGKFGMAEAVVLITMSAMGRIFLTFPRVMAETAGQAAWLSSLAGLAISLLLVYMFHIILRPYPDKNFVQVAEQSLGRIAGTAANIFISAFLIGVAAILTRTFSEALILTALPRTPISVITAGYVGMGLLGAYVGLESVARSTRVTYPFVVVGMSVLLFSLVPQWDPTQLFPLLGTGPVDVFLNGGSLAGVVFETLIAAVIVQSFHDPGMYGKILARAMLMNFGYLVLLQLALVMTVTWTVAQEFTLPFFEVSRLIILGRYFTRVESIFIIIWGYIGMIKVALTLYAAAVTFSGALKLPDYRPLLWPLALMMFVGSLIPKDLPSTVKFEAVFLRIIGCLPIVIIPLAVLAAGRIRSGGAKK